MNPNRFDIELFIKQPTPNQISNFSFMLDYRQISKEAKIFRSFLLDLLNSKIDFSSIPENEVFVIKVRRSGERRFDYKSIKNRKVRLMVKQVLEDFYRDSE